MLFRLLGILILTGSLALGWVLMSLDSFSNQPLQLPEAGIAYEIVPGSSLSAVAGDLQQRGYINSAFYFRLMARLEGQAGNIKAGEYHLNAGLTPRSLLTLLVSGQVVNHTLTLVEGWNFRQVLAAVAGHKALKHTLEGLSDEAIMTRLGSPDMHPEGRFLPDTYHFPKGTTDLDFLKRAKVAMEQLLEREWAAREEGLPLKTPDEALILASIVEKETGHAAERPEIAGVFIRRLRKGMRLQTDPTVIYGMGDDFDGNIRRSDLRRDTPYNTYVHRGLPPTPISMPGADALHAVLHPAKGNSLYFVAKGNGQHHFSSTLSEHNRAVRKYQLKR
ncbi:endolytic transglycosylase MltG [Sedimenticola thiotaurini]|uniref:Endolytic murein transglycosylase n=1 Tax=Sedimenticola thiotaurini TaxID=1543721 RepID=A0A0F7JVN5_9GAMM|nr:endolytic transglycosylase MltG [Sedimenticola thiotaurini]AKH19627.1 aminodeoxychorismate lyase [Sedimenticola thiotaurini]